MHTARGCRSGLTRCRLSDMGTRVKGWRAFFNEREKKQQFTNERRESKQYNKGHQRPKSLEFTEFLLSQFVTQESIYSSHHKLAQSEWDAVSPGSASHKPVMLVSLNTA